MQKNLNKVMMDNQHIEFINQELRKENAKIRLVIMEGKKPANIGRESSFSLSTSGTGKHFQSQESSDSESTNSPMRKKLTSSERFYGHPSLTILK